MNLDYPAAEKAYVRAGELQPNIGLHNYASLLSEQGRLDEAIGVLERELELDPLSQPVNTSLVSMLLDANRIDEAKAL